jgi:hypothetical protein
MPGLYEPIGKASSSSFSYATVPYIEYTDANGILTILLYVNNQGSAQENAIHSLIFKVGEGFRNVQ